MLIRDSILNDSYIADGQESQAGGSGIAGSRSKPTQGFFRDLPWAPGKSGLGPGHGAVLGSVRGTPSLPHGASAAKKLLRCGLFRCVCLVSFDLIVFPLLTSRATFVPVGPTNTGFSSHPYFQDFVVSLPCYSWFYFACFGFFFFS